MTLITDLPEEVLHYIFSYIPDQDLFWNVGFCCSRLQDAMLNYTKQIDLLIPPIHDNERLNMSTAHCHIVKGTTVETLLSCKAILRSINFVAIGKIQSSLYKEDIVKDIKLNNSRYCSETPLDRYRNKVGLII